MAELAGHLRAVLRDVLCGHLPPDLVRCATVASAQEPTQRGPQEEPTHEGPIKVRRGRRSTPREPAAVPTPPRAEAQPGVYQPDDQINTTIMRMRRLAARSGEEVPSDEVETGEILNVTV